MQKSMQTQADFPVVWGNPIEKQGLCLGMELIYYYQVHSNTLFPVIVFTLRSIGCNVQGWDMHIGIVSASKGANLLTWGENIFIRVFGYEDGTSHVTFKSSLVFGLVAWGHNRRNIESAAHRLQEMLEYA